MKKTRCHRNRGKQKEQEPALASIGFGIACYQVSLLSFRREAFDKRNEKRESNLTVTWQFRLEGEISSG
jgi:uncharacterized protein (DUF2225 family)